MLLLAEKRKRGIKEEAVIIIVKGYRIVRCFVPFFSVWLIAYTRNME